jgi:hypothetical protein
MESKLEMVDLGVRQTEHMGHGGQTMAKGYTGFKIILQEVERRIRLAAGTEEYLRLVSNVPLSNSKLMIELFVF